MKICLMVFALSGHGGMETVILSTRREFLNRGYQCELILLGGTQDCEWLSSISAIELGSPRTPRIMRYLQYAFRLPYLLWSYNPDVVIATHAPGVFLASKICRTLRLHADIVFWPHWHPESSSAKTIRLANYHFAISSGLTRLLTKLIGDDKHVHTVFNAIDLDVPPVVRSKSPVFLNVGRLQVQKQKRTDDLLRAAAMLTGNFELRIVGSGEDDKALHQLATDLGITNQVSWLGWQKDPWSVTGEASVVVLCSSWEGFPMVLGEALARGLPCISTDCPSGPEDLIENGNNGWLVPVGNITQLAAAMQNVIDNLDTLPSADVVRQSGARFGTPRVVESMIAAFKSEQSR